MVHSVGCFFLNGGRSCFSVPLLGPAALLRRPDHPVQHGWLSFWVPFAFPSHRKSATVVGISNRLNVFGICRAKGQLTQWQKGYTHQQLNRWDLQARVSANSRPQVSDSQCMQACSRQHSQFTEEAQYKWTFFLTILVSRIWDSRAERL